MKNVDELLKDIDWDKYFDVEVSEELFEHEDVDWDENCCVVFPRLIQQSH